MSLNHWSSSWKKPRFFVIDARVTLIVLISVVYWSFYLLSFCFLTVSVLYYIEKRKRISLNAALRSILTGFVNVIQGRRRPVLPMGRRNFYFNPYDYDQQNPNQGFVKAIPSLPDFDDPKTFETKEEIDDFSDKLERKKRRR